MNRKLDNSKTGFSILETISVIIIAGVLIWSFWTWFSSYQIKTKTAEAQTMLKLIFDAEFLYYNQHPSSSSNLKQFLPLSPEPREPTSQAQFGNFSQGNWAMLNATFINPVYYSYSVETNGVGPNASFIVIARGGLNGDQHFSRWEMNGKLDFNGKPVGKDFIYSLDPWE